MASCGHKQKCFYFQKNVSYLFNNALLYSTLQGTQCEYPQNILDLVGNDILKEVSFVGMVEYSSRYIMKYLSIVSNHETVEGQYLAGVINAKYSFSYFFLGTHNQVRHH